MLDNVARLLVDAVGGFHLRSLVHPSFMLSSARLLAVITLPTHLGVFIIARHELRRLPPERHLLHEAKSVFR